VPAGWIPGGGGEDYRVLDCPACHSIDIRVRTSRISEVGPVVVLECHECQHSWKITQAPVRALVVSLQSRT
jgi:hypothetical protein